MTPVLDRSRKTTRTIGELCVGGDWACAHGDLSGLRQVALRLAAYTPEPVHCDLVELAQACLADPDRAGLLWSHLKDRLFRAARS